MWLTGVCPVIALGLVACGGSSSSHGASGSGGAPSCGAGGVSDLTDVTLVFPEQPCTFTLAQAAAGIEIQYAGVSIDSALLIRLVP